MSEQKANVPHMWIIEMFCGGKWCPTVGSQITKEDAKSVRRQWEAMNPHDKFRIAKYVREK